MSTTSYAQVNLSQSSPVLNWKEIEDKNFKIVFPDYITPKAQYILNILNYYHSLVSETYDIPTKKITIVLRPELALPNGFVTLAPRRSEWFTNSAITPLVGSLEWFQSLAIHEYRHVVQMDFLNRSNIKSAYYLFGDSLTSVFMNIVMPNWYFEGDAVWTETALSDAGRGRSPRFSARLHALLASGDIPSYDEFLAGAYDRPIPNLYVYGYFLITNGYNKFGPKIWKEVAAIASDSPLNPFAFYNAFLEVTATDFEQFYRQTMQELSKDWHKKLIEKNEKKQIYTTYAYPLENKKSLVYLKKTLDSFWTLFERKNEKEVEVAELNISPDFSKPDSSSKNFIYTQIQSDSRYNYKSYSDLFMINLEKKTHKRLTYNKRIYHPKFNLVANKIAAIEYTNKNKWVLNTYDLTGKKLNTFISKPDFQFAEVAWKDENTFYTFTLDEQGKKRISEYNTTTKRFTPLSIPTRNNLYNLNFYEGSLYFEADDLGVNNIIKFDPIEKQLSRCTSESIGAYNPSIFNGRLTYVKETASGKKIAQKSIGCEALTQNIFISKNYLSAGPKDSYTRTDPIVTQASFIPKSKQALISEYRESENALTPHSWDYILGRGSQLSAQATNYLNTLNIFAYIGSSSEDQLPFTGVSLSYSKYHPIFTMNLSYSKEEEEINMNQQKTRWDEYRTSVGITLPYTQTENLYTLSSALITDFGTVSVGTNDSPFSDEISNDQIIKKEVGLNISYLKQLRFRETNPSLGFVYSTRYKDFRIKNPDDYQSYLVNNDMTLYLPGMLSNDSFFINSNLEVRSKQKNQFNIHNNYFSALGYTFSRGFDYEYTPRFHKTSLNYTATLAYPNSGLADWIFVKKMNMNIFLDHTYSEFTYGARTLVSNGLEFFYESLALRKFPVKLGMRFTKKSKDQNINTAFFITL